MQTNSRALGILVCICLLASARTSSAQLNMVSPVQDRYPVWDGSGEHVWFYSNRMGEWDLFRSDPSGSSLERMTDDPGREVTPVPSPDGQWVVFAYYAPGQDEEDLMLMDLHSKEWSVLVTGSGADASPAWSDDGNSVVFSSNRGGNYDIWKVDIHSGAMTQLTDTPQREDLPAVSPDGKWIAFQRTMAARNADIIVRPLDGGEEVNVSSWDGWDGWPSFRNDNEVLFASNRSGSSQLWAVKPDGTGLRQVTEIGGMRVRRAHWSPDGRSILTNLEAPGMQNVFAAVLEHAALLPEQKKTTE